MSSRRRQSRHLLYASLSPVSSSLGSSFVSPHSHNQSKLSTCIHPLSSSIHSSSSSTQPHPSSYETLKKLHHRYIHSTQAKENIISSSPIQDSLTPSTSTHLHSYKSLHSLEMKVLPRHRGLKQLDPNLPKIEKPKLGQDLKSLRPQKVSSIIHPSDELWLLSNHSKSPISSQTKINEIIERDSDPPLDPISSSHLLLNRHSRLEWDFMNDCSRAQIESPLSNQALISDDHQPIRVTDEPLLFAMSPLCSETGWTPPDHHLTQPEEEEATDFTLFDDDSEDSILSNTSLEPINIPGTTPLHLSRSHSSLSTTLAPSLDLSRLSSNVWNASSHYGV